MAMNDVIELETALAREKEDLIITNKGEEIINVEMVAPKNKGLEGNNINAISSVHGTCMEKNNEEITEAWEPYEWLDCEIQRLNNELMQRDNNVEKARENNDNIKSNNKEKASGKEDEEEKKTNCSEEGRNRSGGCWSSCNAESISGGEWYSASCGSGFDDQEWLDWNWTAGGGDSGGVDEISQNNQWKLWDDDEGDKLLCWLWDSDINGGEAN